VWWRPWHVKQIRVLSLLFIYADRSSTVMWRNRAHVRTGCFSFLQNSHPLGLGATLVGIYSSRRCTRGECFRLRLTRTWRSYERSAYIKRRESTLICFTCHGRHHTLLHRGNSSHRLQILLQDPDQNQIHPFPPLPGPRTPQSKINFRRGIDPSWWAPP